MGSIELYEALLESMKPGNTADQEGEMRWYGQRMKWISSFRAMIEAGEYKLSNSREHETLEINMP